MLALHNKKRATPEGKQTMKITEATLKRANELLKYTVKPGKRTPKNFDRVKAGLKTGEIKCVIHEEKRAYRFLTEEDFYAGKHLEPSFWEKIVHA